MSRLWRRLGFGRPAIHVPDPLQGYADTYLMLESHLALGWRARLRVLISGRVLAIVTVQTDAPVARSLAYTTVGVLAPGEK